MSLGANFKVASEIRRLLAPTPLATFAERMERVSEIAKQAAKDARQGSKRQRKGGHDRMERGGETREEEGGEE